LRVGASLPLVDPGQRYSVGDHIQIGDESPAWAELAVVEVTGVDEDGGITTTSIVEGGRFTGEDILGNYELTPFETALLLMASSSQATSNSQGRAAGDAQAGSSAAAAYAAILVAVLVTAALIAASMQQRFSSNSEHGGGGDGGDGSFGFSRSDLIMRPVMQTGHATTLSLTPDLL
jgi:hypothetical protein